MKLAFVDMDKIVADNTERDIKAQHFADSRFVREEGIIPSVVYREAWRDLYYGKRGLHNPEWIDLDVPIEGAVKRIGHLEYDYQVLFLTSRPEYLREVTTTWLVRQCVLHHLDDKMRLIMKPSAFKYTKTPLWKAGMVQTFIAFYGASEAIVVDDNYDVLAEIKKQPMPCPVHCYYDLKMEEEYELEEE